MNRTIVGSLSLLVAGTLTGDVFAADARKGETLAKRWCANCHIVSVDQQRGTTQAPPFSAIAKKSDFNEGKLAYFLLNPHPKMPDMNLSRSEASDLAAYIGKQK